MTDETTWVKLSDLAARWGVSRPTATNRTRTEGFPPPLVLGPRSLRWPEEEVLAWEQQERTARVHTVTKTQPGFRAPATRKPAQVRRIVTRPAA